ncbi:hypothetical protein [Ammoniphilus sp. CFH 90114]|uniref:hypothetical protein n=1 Tax=Ammoniphilus sp. CFH 90114 TaxID=2493665 RepID=UPI00100FF737|nr:hypothetical protein [Ammoniphilus sp. CFH 90114]RXT03802.1 hypothetical protein EIZ39_22750 [Ammoniphilus sp. CFH 90114]
MDRRISLLLGVLVGMAFIFLYGYSSRFEGLFESFTSLIMTFLLLVGFLSVVVFGFALLLEALRHLRK